MDNMQAGFSLENRETYKHPFEDYSNFGFAAQCQASAEHPFSSYLFGTHNPQTPTKRTTSST